VGFNNRKSFPYLSIVIFNQSYDGHPLKFGEPVLWLGEIPNAPGHGAVAKKDGAVIWLVHPGDFREATEDEV